jgi:hypothetical protein
MSFAALSKKLLDLLNGKSAGSPIVPLDMAKEAGLGDRLDFVGLLSRTGGDALPAASFISTKAGAAVLEAGNALALTQTDNVATGVGGSVNVDNLSGLTAGQRFTIRLADASKNIVLRNHGGGTGNIRTPGATDITLDVVTDTVGGFLNDAGLYIIDTMSVAALLPANLSTALASNANGQGASLIGLEDPLGYVVGTTGEAGIVEVATVTSDVAGAVDGLHAVKVAHATFDPSANSGHRTIGAHTLGVTIPAKGIVKRAYYQVVTTCADGASDNATLAISVEGANDIVTAIAISDVTNVWDAGFHDAKPDGTAAHFVQASVARLVTVTVAVHELTAGKVIVFLEYVMGL